MIVIVGFEIIRRMLVIMRFDGMKVVMMLVILRPRRRVIPRMAVLMDMVMTVAVHMLVRMHKIPVPVRMLVPVHVLVLVKVSVLASRCHGFLHLCLEFRRSSASGPIGGASRLTGSARRPK